MKKENATKLKSLLIFFDLLDRINEKEVNYFKQRYLQNAENFEDCIDLLSSINLINISLGHIEPTFQLVKFLKKSPSENEIKEFLLNEIFSEGGSFIWDYLKNFSLINGKFIFEPQISEKLLFSNVRNLIIELELIIFNVKENYYEIKEKYTYSFINSLRKRSFNPQVLKKLIEEQDAIGRLAEMEIISYEKSRLSPHKNLLEKIEHKSLKDTSAGYDVRSFTVSENLNVTERFIEVKAIPKLEKKFYLTRNELETSRIHGLNFYLYLLPVIGKYRFDISNLIIIQDPSSKIFDSDNWIVECEQFSILKKQKR